MFLKNYIFHVTLIIWLFLDLFTKYLANIYFNEKINILWDFLFLTYVENPWIAFSIKIPFLFLKIITISLIILIFYYYKTERKQINKKLLFDISFWLILSWAIWNGIWRIFNENVVDFIWVKYFSIFNLADSFITIWVFIYITFSIFQRGYKKGGEII